MSCNKPLKYFFEINVTTALVVYYSDRRKLSNSSRLSCVVSVGGGRGNNDDYCI